MADATPYSLLADLEQVRHKGKPPIHLWNPEKVSDIDMTIEADGSWMYLGTPITRQRLAHLFSTVLRRETDGEFYLVTPVHPIRVAHNPDTGEPAPYIMIRDGLEAKITRNVYYQLANLVVEHDDVLGVWSSSTFFPLS